MRIITAISAFLICIAAYGARPLAATADRAERAFMWHEWPNASALYTLMLHDRPDSVPLYGRAIVCDALATDSMPTHLLEQAMAHGVALDSLLDCVHSSAYATGHAHIYEKYMLACRSSFAWLARGIDARLLDYYITRNDAPRIIHYARSMLAGLPGDERYSLILAKGLMLAGDSPAASAQWLAVLDRNPDCYEALIELGNLYILRSQPADGLPLLRRAYELRPTPYVKSILQKYQ